jgi:hypothetical protein
MVCDGVEGTGILDFGVFLNSVGFLRDGDAAAVD